MLEDDANNLLASFAGLLYLSLWLSSKFAISIPFFPRNTRPQPETPSATSRYTLRHRRNNRDEPFIPHRDEAAAPPLWLVCVAYVPIGGAIYISASRYFDFRHHGFDILSGAFVGIVIAILAFRFYHVPLGHGVGYAWGPRSRAKAFGVGVGRYGWVDEEDQGDYDLPTSRAREFDVGSGESTNRMLPAAHV